MFFGKDIGDKKLSVEHACQYWDIFQSTWIITNKLIVQLISSAVILLEREGERERERERERKREREREIDR